MKHLSTFLLFIIATITIACNGVNDDSVNDVIDKVTRYLNNEDYNSIKTLSDTVSKNPDLGLAVINCTKDSSALLYETMIASMVTPQIAAEVLITDMLDMPVNSNNSKLIRLRVMNIISTYSKIGNDKNTLIFKHAIDSCFSTRTINEQAKLYTLSTPPAQLGKIVKKEPNNNAIIEAIKLQYTNQSDIVLFQNALK